MKEKPVTEAKSPRSRGRFITTLKIEDLPGGKVRLLKPLRYRAADGRMFVIPAGFECDKTSSLLKRRGDHDIAAVLHDWLYSTGAVTRGEADGLYLEAMQALDVSWVISRLYHAGVRVGGWKAWRSHRNRDKRKNDLLKAS